MTEIMEQPKLAKASKKTKAATISRLLSREKGATLDEIMKATGWQAHSCRAFLTGLRKKSTDLIKEDRGGKTAYRANVPEPDASAQPADTATAADA